MFENKILIIKSPLLYEIKHDESFWCRLYNIVPLNNAISFSFMYNIIIGIRGCCYSKCIL